MCMSQILVNVLLHASLSLQCKQSLLYRLIMDCIHAACLACLSPFLPILNYIYLPIKGWTSRVEHHFWEGKEIHHRGMRHASEATCEGVEAARADRQPTNNMNVVARVTKENGRLGSLPCWKLRTAMPTWKGNPMRLVGWGGQTLLQQVK